jgi:NAD(P)H-dependent flavin oxidoreductase YrpB (nitropropane dioxygenase family)
MDYMKSINTVKTYQQNMYTSVDIHINCLGVSIVMNSFYENISYMVAPVHILDEVNVAHDG